MKFHFNMFGTAEFYDTSLFQVVTVYFYRLYNTFGTAEQRNSTFRTTDRDILYIVLVLFYYLLFYCSKVVNKIY